MQDGKRAFKELQELHSIYTRVENRVHCPSMWQVLAASIFAQSDAFVELRPWRHPLLLIEIAGISLAIVRISLAGVVQGNTSPAAVLERIAALQPR